MNEKIMRACGFAKEVEEIKSGRCPFCRCNPYEQGFRDRLSEREFSISGLCQACQDRTFS